MPRAAVLPICARAAFASPRVYGQGAFILFGVATVAGLFSTSDRPAPLLAGAIAALCVTIATAFIAGRALLRQHFARAAVVMGGGMLAFVAVMYELYFPYYAPLRVSAQLAAILQANGGYGQPGYMIDYKEPSLAFHAGGGLREQPHNDYLSNTDLQKNDSFHPHWIVITERAWKQHDEEAMKQWTIVGRVEGIAYNAGGRQAVIVLHHNFAR